MTPSASRHYDPDPDALPPGLDGSEYELMIRCGVCPECDGNGRIVNNAVEPVQPVDAEWYCDVCGFNFS